MLLVNIGVILGIYVVCYLLGYPIRCFVLSPKLNKYDGVITPWLGFSMGMLIMYYLGRLGISVQRASLGLVVIFIFLDIILMAKIKTYPNINKKIVVIGLSILVICTVFLTLPNYIYNNNNVLVLGNNDFVIYSAISNALKNNSIKSLIYNENLQGVVLQWIQGSQSRLLCLWIAFCSSFFKVSIFMATLYIAVFAYLMLILSFLLLLDRYANGWTSKVIAAIFILFNCNFLYLLYQGFVAQLISIGLMIMITFILLESYDKYAFKISLILGILVIGLAMAYGEIIPVLVVPMVVWCIVELILSKGKAIAIIKNYISAALIVLIIYGRAYKTVFSMFNTSRLAKVGWDIEAGYLWQSLGIYNVFKKDLFGTKNWPFSFLIVSSVLVLIILLYVILKKRNDIKFRILGIYGIVNACLYAMFLVTYDLYKSYKALANMSYIFILILLLVSLEKSVKDNIEKWIYNLKKVILALTSFGIITSGLVIYFQVFALGECVGEGKYAVGGVIGEGHSELEKIAEEYAGYKFYLSGNNYWNSIAALTILEQEDVVIMDTGEIYWWNGKIVDPLPIESNEEIIYIDSTLIREPINLEGEIIEENEYYTVKKVFADYPVCTNRMQMESNRIIQYMPEGNVICGRKFKQNDLKLSFRCGKSQTETIYMELWNISGESNKLEIIRPDGQAMQYDLEAGERKEFIIEDVYFEANKENIFQFKVENCDLYMLNFSFFENKQSSLKAEHIGQKVTKYKWLSLKGLKECIKEKLAIAPMNEEQMKCELELSIDEAEICKTNSLIDGYINMTNKSGEIIASTGGDTPISIGVQLCNKEGNVINYDFERIPINKYFWFDNQKITIEFSINIPMEGIENGYKLRFIPLQEGVAWFPDSIESNYAYLQLNLKED